MRFQFPKPMTAIAAAALAAMAGEAAAGPKVTTFELENGLKGVVIEDHRAPVATHMVWYRIGAADEPDGESGVAHFLEHLMFKGTDKIPAGRFSEIVAENGGEDNAFTSRDFTAYFQRVAADRLPMMMEMEADRMTGLVIAPDQVASERDVVLEERSMRTDNDPSSRFREQMEAALYLNHPYGAPVIGWRSEIEALDRDKALAFYRRFYGPQNATLVVAGDVDPKEVEALARKYYGPIKTNGVKLEHRRPKEPPHYAARRLEMKDPRVTQPMIYRSYLAPSAVTGDQDRGAALGMFEQVIGGGATSRLYKALVTDQKSAVAAGAYYMGDSIDETSFVFYAVPAEGASLPDLEKAMDAVIADFLKTGPDAAELARAKTGAIADEVYAQDNQQSMAYQFGSLLSMGATLDQIVTWRERVRAVTAEAVQDAARDLIKPENSVTGYLTRAEDDTTDKS